MAAATGRTSVLRMSDPMAVAAYDATAEGGDGLAIAELLAGTASGFRERAALEPADGDLGPATLDVLGPVAGVSEEQCVVRRGSAADELVAETRDLGLLVMGARRLGTMRSTLLGSISTAVLRRAHGPVIVCPTRR